MRWIRGIRITVILLLSALAATSTIAGEVFIYSSQGQMRGLDLDAGTDRFLSNSPLATSVNATALNVEAGIIYYGDQTSVYRWNPELGNGPAAHALMNDFSVGPLTANITNINSTGGSFLGDKYYVGSESNAGYIQDIYELSMSIDGTQVVSVQALDLQAACACTEVQLGGFGDIAAVMEGGLPVIYGSSADLSGNGQGTQSGRWRFTPATGSFQLLAAGTGGQLSASPSGRLFSNAGAAVREVDKNTGLLIGPTLITASAAIYDFTGGFAIDFGDAPDSYGSAFHRLAQPTAAYIGVLPPDNEAGSLNNFTEGTDGAGDDADGSDDEDAVSGTLSLSSNNASYTLSVQCSAGARVAGWIDSNINGVFDTNERNANHPVSCTAGQATLVWSGLTSAIAGNSYLRLRASTNLSAISRPIGVATDGEAEDHPIVITGGTTSGSCPTGSTSHVYTASDLPINIGPNAGTTAVSTISIAETGTIVDVNVLGIAGTHTYINDLIFDLRHAGTTRRLYGPSCGSQNNFSFGFDGAANGTPPCPPIDGNTYPPTQSLAPFNGQSIVGDWQLRIRDRFNGDAGVLQSWGLELCTSGGGIVEAPDIVVGKSASVSGSRIDFTLSLANTGNADLSSLSIADDLTSVFGAGNYSITAQPAIVSGPSGFVANSNFNGATDSELLASSSQLPPGEQVDLEFSVNVDTIANSATPGQYSNQAQASAISPSAVTVTDLSGTGLNLANDTDDPTVFQVETSATLSGYVFEDAADDVTTAHDGVIQANESGVANRVVSAVDIATGSVLATSVTDASGFWQLLIDESNLNQEIQIEVQQDTLSRFVSEAIGYSVGSLTDGIVSVTPGYGQTFNQINIGVVGRPTLAQDRSSSASPGDTVVYPHRFVASTFGEVAVTTNTAVTPVNPAWSTVVYLDANCNELVDTFEVLWPGSTTLDKDEELCLLISHNVPATATDGTNSISSVNAEFSVSDDSGTGHALVFDLMNQDVITVVRVGAGRLELEKTVSNITLGGAELVTNTALPGHVLEYSILYRNAGDGPLTELSIDDAAPSFTQVLGATVSCNTTPATLVCTPSISGAAVGWVFTGSLAAGQQGTVSYRVTID